MAGQNCLSGLMLGLVVYTCGERVCFGKGRRQDVVTSISSWGQMIVETNLIKFMSPPSKLVVHVSPLFSVCMSFCLHVVLDIESVFVT